MIDFMDRDDQEMIRIQEEFLQAARAINCSCSFTVRASLPAWSGPIPTNSPGKGR